MEITMQRVIIITMYLIADVQCDAKTLHVSSRSQAPYPREQCGVDLSSCGKSPLLHMASKIDKKFPSRFLRISLLETFPARRHHVLRQRLVFVQELVECAHDIGRCGGLWPLRHLGRVTCKRRNQCKFCLFICDFGCEVKTLRLPCKAFGWSIRFLIGHLCSCSFQDLGWHRLKSESMKSHRRRCLCMSHCHQVMMLLFTIFCHLAVLGDSRVKHSQGSTEMDDFHEWYWFADDSLMSLSAFLMRFLTSRGTATPKIFGPLISILVWIRWFFSKNLKISYDTWTYIYIYMMYEKYAALFYRRIFQEFPGWCSFSDTAQALGTGHGLGSGGHKEDSKEFLIASINI